MSKNLKISLAMVALAAVAVLVAANTGSDDGATTTATSGDTRAATSGDTRADRVVRPDSQRLSVAADGKVTFVEFLDFECEACGAAYPAIEQLREQFGDRVTFVVRNFPLHSNSEAAARAAEAAAGQGMFEEMYGRLFQTQTQWAEKRTSQQEVFFGYAVDLGLDMTRFRAAYDDPATLVRIRRDKADGQALGVTGTPTFFLNGDKIEVSSFAGLVRQIDNALAG